MILITMNSGLCSSPPYAYEGGDERGGWTFLQSLQRPPTPPPS